jgi:hypothetical protein
MGLARGTEEQHHSREAREDVRYGFSLIPGEQPERCLRRNPR